MTEVKRTTRDDIELAVTRLYDMRDKLPASFVENADWDAVYDRLSESDLVFQVGPVLVMFDRTLPWYSTQLVLHEVITVRNYNDTPDWPAVFNLARKLAGDGNPIAWGNSQPASGMDKIIKANGGTPAGNLYWIANG
jgi:hypothetical protein